MTVKFWLSFLFILPLAGLTARADDLQVKRRTVVGMLSVKNGEPAKLILNPAHQTRFTFQVKNSEWISRWIKKADFFGLVRVEVDMEPARKSVQVLKIEPVRARRIPRYDSDFKAVVRGEG